jgi:hypothetical protein
MRAKSWPLSGTNKKKKKEKKETSLLFVVPDY